MATAGEGKIITEHSKSKSFLLSLIFLSLVFLLSYFPHHLFFTYQDKAENIKIGFIVLWKGSS